MNNDTDTLTETLEQMGTRPSRYTQRCQMIEEHGRLTSEEK